MKRVTVPMIRRQKNQNKIVMITAYDAEMARILDDTGVDIILVGDSLGTAVLGYPDTLKVTIDDMVHHVAAVARGSTRCLLVGDLPFGSTQISGAVARQHAVALIRAGAHAVKFEGTGRLESIRELVENGIPVMGHLGLTPQSIHALGGYRVQGRSASERDSLIDAAHTLEHAGVFAIVLECVPDQTAEAITRAVSIPTIGIGAGPSVDGQVLVVNDLLNMNPVFKPRFVKQYADISAAIRSAVSAYADEVRTLRFPDPEHSYRDDE
ncbi:3-methyl-2-oxobutanoate hydroxymethyltransferase [bacterium]|nr:3-methyl-2-oxobutanoate hydroxymethyltransferase [candidate division CSSED10-310 bacterium]